MAIHFTWRGAPSLTLPRFAGEGGLGAAENDRAWQGKEHTSAARFYRTTAQMSGIVLHRRRRR
jgi:hypothetical protein